MIAPDRFRTLPCPTYPEIRLALAPGRQVGARLRQLRARLRAHRDRGPARPRRAAPVHPARHPVHDLLPHPLPRISQRPGAGAAGAGLRLDALVPPALGRRDGRDRQHPARSRGARLRQSARLVARRRHGAVPPRPRAGARAAAAGPPLCRPGRASRRTSRPFSRCRSPAASSWSATARSSRPSGRAIPRSTSPAPSSARSSPGTMSAATCSCSRAAPTPSASCCSRRWPPACRSPPTRCRGRST